MEEYIEAGKIASQAREYAKKIVKPKIKILEIAEKIENFIREKGGEPAFPVNVGINNVAAHYTPERNDLTEVRPEHLIKVDIGVHINGFIADTAITMNLNKKFHNLIECCESALSKAIKLAKPGVRISEIGSVIEEEIKSKGFFPIKNLGGHFLSQYIQHTGEIIPNFNNKSNKTLKEGDVIAIEPFASDSIEFIFERGIGNIYKYERGNVRTSIERRILENIKNYRGLPFASRWIKGHSLETLKLFLGRMSNAGIVHSYPILMGPEESLIAQAEHTIIVAEKPIVITE